MRLLGLVLLLVCCAFVCWMCVVISSCLPLKGFAFVGVFLPAIRFGCWLNDAISLALSTSPAQPRASDWIFIASARLELSSVWVWVWVRFIARFDKPPQCCVNCYVAYRVYVCVCVWRHCSLKTAQHANFQSFSFLFYLRNFPICYYGNYLWSVLICLTILNMKPNKVGQACHSGCWSNCLYVCACVRASVRVCGM